MDPFAIQTGPVGQHYLAQGGQVTVLDLLSWPADLARPVPRGDGLFTRIEGLQVLRSNRGLAAHWQLGSMERLSQPACHGVGLDLGQCDASQHDEGENGCPEAAEGMPIIHLI